MPIPAYSERDSCVTNALGGADYDGLILVVRDVSVLTNDLLFESISPEIQEHLKVAGANLKCVSGTHVVYSNAISHHRVIVSGTGPVDRDHDDIRRYYDAGQAGVEAALKCGAKNLQLAIGCLSISPDETKAVLYGAFQGLYTPLEIREDVPNRRQKAVRFDLLCHIDDTTSFFDYLQLCKSVELGRIVCRDIGGTDPERMAPPRVLDYVKELFKDSVRIKTEVVSDEATFKKRYPLLAAVNRCASVVERHRGRLIRLFYEPPDMAAGCKTVYLIGKGICYDTGGADVKAGGHMASMHRDKCGAAAVLGFFKILDELKPKNLRVIAGVSMVRNSIGSNSYVADEIITSRAGKRVRVGNTDAEGRMVMADVLCEMKERALELIKKEGADCAPELFTWATLTGHVCRAYGDNYTAILCNGPAKERKLDEKIRDAGDRCSDLFEISTIRREDYEFHTGKSEYEDVLQCNNLPSTLTDRGHQSPAAFLIMASGLDAHGRDSEQPLAYSHVDCAGSSGPFPGVPTGAPILAFVQHYVLPNL